MTNNNTFAKSKKRFFGILLFSLVFLLSICCSFACSCNEEDPATDDYDPSFSYSDIVEDEEEVYVSNRNFTLGLTEKDKDDYPVSSMTGWSLSTDTSAVSSAVTSGIINTSSDMWKATVEELVADKVFLDWAKANYNPVFGDDATNAQKAEALITAGFTSPARTDADDNVLMLNNYTDNENNATNLGTAQSAKSASTISLEKGEALEVIFYARTDAKMSSFGTAYGANFRVDTTINSVTQAQYAIKNINTNGQWEKFTIYIRGNDNVATSVSFSFGLGFYSLNDTQLVTGTAYFDDLSVRKMPVVSDDPNVDTYESARNNQPTPIYAQTYASLSSTTFNGDPEGPIGNRYRIDSTGRRLFFYSLADDIKGYVSTQLGVFDYTDFADGLNASKIAHFDNGKVEVDKQVAGLKTNAITVPANSFAIVRFTVKNNLSKYYADGVKIFLLDKNATTGDVLGKSSPLTSEVFTDIDKNDIADETTYTITVVNSFPTTVADVREFELVFIVGPQNPVEQTTSTYFPVGEVEVKDLTYKVATADALDDISSDTQYKFINSLSNGTFSNFLTYSLYAGQDAVYTEETETETYNVTISGINQSNIARSVVNASQYTGVVYDHRMVKDEGFETAVNTLKTAGVINSKYLDEYKTASQNPLPNVNLGTLEKDDEGNDIHIQPLVIYNPTASSYGFIGAKQTVSANSYAKVTLKVKVDGDAKAYVYIVNMNNDDNQLDVLTHTVGETTNSLALEVSNTNGEWITLTFNIGAGATELNYRLEMWNGARSSANETKSAGYVYFNEINYTSFVEPTRLNDIYLSAGNELADAIVKGDLDISTVNTWKTHTQELTAKEVEFNAEYPDQAISYTAKYVWVKSNNFVYAVYNTIDPTVTDPYASIESEETEEETEDTGCTAKFDPATFWLQFSTILLAVVLALAVLLLIIKTIRKNHKKSVKVKSRYTVRSRNFAQRRYETPVEEPSNSEPATDDVVEDSETPVEEETAEDTEYVYDEVIEDFGETVIDGTEVELPTEEVTEAPATEEPTDAPVEDGSEENKD